MKGGLVVFFGLFLLSAFSLVSAFPDLTPYQPSVAVMPRTNDCIVNMTSRVLNQANDSAPASLAAWILGSSTWLLNVSSIIPGGIVVTNPPAVTTVVSSGWHVATFYVDYRDALFENSEANNNYTASFNCAPTNGTNQTHLACVNFACVSVAGGGSNQCTSSAQCQTNATHFECRNAACVVVNGTGQSACTTNSQCQSHFECRNLACMNVSG